jgi:microcystin-dependent protein
MAEPFIGEIRQLSFNFAPKGWALCNGQLFPINQNEALFSLLGTTYGGDGRVNFGLPNLQGRVPIHIGSGHVQGEAGGEQNHTLSTSELPAHNHSLNATTAVGTAAAIANTLIPAAPTAANAFFYASPPMGQQPPLIAQTMDPRVVGSAGGSQPHNNMMPYLCINFAIALQGIFPSQN